MPLPAFLLIPALLLWAAWCLSLGRVTPLASSPWARVPLYFLLPACGTLLAWRLTGSGLLSAAAWTVGVSQAFAAGILWLSVAPWLVPWLGLHAREDVAERRNPLVGWVLTGASLGVSLGYGALAAGRVTGEEEWGGFLAVALGAVSLASLYAFWGVLEWVGRLSEAITVERDGGPALRLAGFLLSCGWMLGLALPWLVASWPAAQARGDGWKGVLALLSLAALLLVGSLVERSRRGIARPLAAPAWADAGIALGYASATAAVALMVRP